MQFLDTCSDKLDKSSLLLTIPNINTVTDKSEPFDSLDSSSKSSKYRVTPNTDQKNATTEQHSSKSKHNGDILEISRVLENVPSSMCVLERGNY